MPAALVAVLAGLAPGGVIAQEPSDDGSVRLGITYEPGRAPALSVAPVGAPSDLEVAAREVRLILERDLDYSDRFRITPPLLERVSDPPNYALWNEADVVYLVAADLTGTATRPVLRVGLHDVVYGTMTNVQAFSLPSPASPTFRMAVHRVSDRIVSWATGGQQGMAATRIAFRRRSSDGRSSLWIVDSDGENLTRVETGSADAVYSPSFSPDGTRIAYTSRSVDATYGLHEVNLLTGRREEIASGQLLLTPEYTPGGELVWAWGRSGRTSIVTERGAVLSDTGADALNPTFSPDGRQMAYVSDPAGQPQIYVREVGRAPARRISVYVRGERSNAATPDWSPDGRRIAYSALAAGQWRIHTVNPDGTDRRQITSRGDSEMPSWAPDSRHLVFSVADSRGNSMWIADTVTGRSRILTSGFIDELADWSTPVR